LFLNGYVDKNAATLILCLRVKRTPRLTDLNSASVSNERGSPRPARAGSNLVGRGIAKPYPQQSTFEQYLKAQKRRNVRQVLCYAQRYHKVLETGDASALASLSSGALRRHAMEALTAYAKYAGSYEEWCQIRKSYSLKWTNGDESLQAMHKFFSDELNFDVMLQRIKEMIAKTPTWIGQIIKFACVIRLRPSEVLESVRLINNISGNTRINPSSSYYNPQRQTLEHFRFPEIFIRQTKKAYLSFVTPEMLDIVHQVNNVPTIGAITKVCHRRHTRMDMHLTRKIFASYLRQEGIQPEVVDMLQGRVSPSVLTRHYLVPKPLFKEEVLQALEKLQQQL
jgi:hypothetical protein